MTIVEINPGYLPLIAEHSNVSSLLHNPKVHIVTDDGRRWLTSHPDRRFDFVLLNMTYYWRANSSNLLSADFLRLVRSHLNPGGVFFYNTTWSDEVQATGANVFPYAWRIANFLAVSDSSIILNKERLRDALRDYTIDGRKVFDLTDPKQTAYFEKILRVAEPSQAESRPPDELGIDSSTLVESRESMLNRLKGVRLTTDDNMGQEWRH
jgi:spermidine synthase